MWKTDQHCTVTKCLHITSQPSVRKPISLHSHVTRIKHSSPLHLSGQRDLDPMCFLVLIFLHKSLMIAKWTPKSCLHMLIFILPRKISMIFQILFYLPNSMLPLMLLNFWKFECSQERNFKNIDCFHALWNVCSYSLKPRPMVIEIQFNPNISELVLDWAIQSVGPFNQSLYCLYRGFLLAV